MHYFSQNKYYFLVEDSTGEHRPIVVKEYERPYRGDDGDWPILWGGIEGRTGFYHYDGEITYERKVPPPAPIAQPAAADEKASSRVTAPNLRRALSLQNVARGAAAAGAVGGAHHHPHDSYIAASGNSQIITSNTGTSTAGVRSGAAAASRFALGQGPIMDKRLAVLSNRTVSVAGGALLGNGPSSTSTNANAVASGSGSAQGGRIAALKRQGPGKLQRSVSVDAGLSRRGLRGTSSTAPPPRDEPKKPGYCENCRLKYDDFKDVSWRFLLSPFLLFERDWCVRLRSCSQHVVSSKHRRFALNRKNWVELDGLLDKIQRPPLHATVHLNDLVLANPLLHSSDAAAAGMGDDSGFYDAVSLGKDGDESEDEEMEGADSASEESEESEASAESESDEEEDEDDAWLAVAVAVLEKEAEDDEKITKSMLETVQWAGRAGEDDDATPAFLLSVLKTHLLMEEREDRRAERLFALMCQLE
jgi:regulatory subunit for Cdc7p protein kinase